MLFITITYTGSGCESGSVFTSGYSSGVKNFFALLLYNGFFLIAIVHVS